jgi:type I restriction enzyme S subunit
MLSDIAKLVMGQSPPSSSYNDIGDGLPFYQGKTDFGATYPTPRIYCREPKKLAEEGDILMSVRAPVGATNLCKGRSCIGRGIAAIRANGIDRDFLYFYLKKIEAYIDSLGSGAIFKAINKSQLAELPINDAGIPLPEQKKIAHILSTVQRAIEAQERIIQTTTELKKALMHKLFTEGLRNEPQKQTEIGPVPESWEVKPLIDTVEFIDYGVSQAIPKTPTPEGVKIVSTADIDKQGNLLYWKIRRIVVPVKTANRLVLKDGDVLFNWRNSAELIGKSAIYEEQDEPHIFASFILRICAGEKKSHNYFLKHLMNHYREEGVFVKLARRAVNQANYNKNEISVLKIPSPPYEQQVEIAKTISAVDAKIWSHADKKRSLENLFRTLLHELMTAKTRVHELECEKGEVA